MSDPTKREGSAAGGASKKIAKEQVVNDELQNGPLYDTVVVKYKGNVVTNPITYKSKNGDCSITINYSGDGFEATIMNFTCEVTMDGSTQSRGMGTGKKLLLDVLKDIRKTKTVSFIKLLVAACGKEDGINLNDNDNLTKYYERLGFVYYGATCMMHAQLDAILNKNGVKIGGKRRTRKSKKKLNKVKKRRVKTKRKRKRRNKYTRRN